MSLPGRGNSGHKDPELGSCLKYTRKSKGASVIGVEWDGIRKAILRTLAFTLCEVELHWKISYRDIYNILIVSVWLGKKCKWPSVEARRRIRRPLESSSIWMMAAWFKAGALEVWEVLVFSVYLKQSQWDLLRDLRGMWERAKSIMTLSQWLSTGDDFGPQGIFDTVWRRIGLP